MVDDQTLGIFGGVGAIRKADMGYELWKKSTLVCEL